MSQSHYKKRRDWRILKDTASVFGFFAIFVEIVNFFPALRFISVFLQKQLIFLTLMAFSLLYGLIKNWPSRSFIFKINNRDVELELVIGNIQEINSAYVIPINSEFDMNLNGSVKIAKSVQSMIINNYFAGDHTELQKKVLKELKSKKYSDQKIDGRYKLGTTLRIETDNKGKIFYFVANSNKLNDKRVEAVDGGLSETLNGLWYYISIDGAKEHISIPLLGTGNGRLKMPREEVFKEIVRSFVASCAGKNYCDRLTIVIRKEDVDKCEIDVEKLVDFMRLQTVYADYSSKTGPAVGSPVC